MRTFLLCVFTWTFSLLLAACQNSAHKADAVDTYPNLPFPTLGGRQLWADVNWYAGWRVQQHVWTGHCRLLDPTNMRRAWGKRPAVEDALRQERRQNELHLSSNHLVVLLHGLGRSRTSMAELQQQLRAAGYEVMDVGYPSTRRSIAEHAAQLNSLLDQIAASEEVQTISFVTHSLGGMMARAALAVGKPNPGTDALKTAAAADVTPAAEPQWRKSLQVHRLVMLAPPSGGSSLAQSLKNFLPFQWLAGDSGQQVTLDEASRIPVPDCKFGIVAGYRKPGKGWNPLLEGEDDGVVRVEETRLPGAEDFWAVPSLHTFIMEDPIVVAGVLHFLQVGKFLADSSSEN